MANINIGAIEASLTLRDQMSPAFETATKAMRAFSDAEQKAEAAMRGMQDQANKMNTAMRVGASGFDKMHAEALKMNAQFASSRGSASGFADSIGKVSTTLARSATAFGLPVGPLRALDDVADVAEIGLRGVEKSALSTAVSFKTLSVAMLGPIAAAAAIGAAIGALLNKFAIVREGADKLVATFERLFTGMSSGDKLKAATQGIGEFSKQMAASNAEAQKKQVESMRAMGVASKDIAEMYKGTMTPELQKQLGLTKELVKAEDDRAAAVKKAAEEQKKFSEKIKAGISDRMIEEAIAGKPTQLGLERMGVSDLLDKALKPGMAGLSAGIAKDLDFSKLVDSFGPVNQQMEHFSFNANAVQDGFNRMAQRMRDAKAPADAIAEALMRDGASAQEAAAAIAQTTKATFDWAGAIQGAVMVAGMFGDKAGQLVGILGNVQQAFANAKTGVDKFNAIASGVGQIGSMIGGKTGGALQGAAGGAMMGLAIGGPVGAVIGGIGGAIMGFISKKKQMAKELTSMREQFVQSAGGMEALKKKAQEAGLSLDALFKARNKDQLSKAIDDIGGKLQTWDEAHEKLQAAVEKYGFTVEELGPKFRQQELDTQAGELLQDYELLKASGIDNNLILSKMAPNMSEYIQTAIRAGSTVPMAMKPAIDAMIQNGQLLDENGQAYASAEAAGITFAQTMSEQFSTLIQKIGDLVAALTGIPNVDRTVTVTTRQEGGGAGAGEGGGDYGGVPEDYRAASGFHAMVRQPTRILVGEAGAERVDVTPQGAEGGAGWGGGAQITFAPVFPGDPLQSNEARRDLSDYQMDQFFRKARNSPLMRATLTQNGRRR